MVLLMIALCLGAGPALAASDQLNQDQDAATQIKDDPSATPTADNEVVGTITSVDGMVYTINDFRGNRHELELADKNVQWGGPTQIGSRVKARVDGNQITELINLEE